MSRWPRRLLAIGVGLFFVGWALVFASGYGGDSTGGSEWVWRIGGIMVYASVPTTLVAGVLGMAAVMRSLSHRSRRA
jgi:hypothetical protein